MKHGKNKIDLSSLFQASNEYDNTAEICAAVVNAAEPIMQSRKDLFKPREKKSEPKCRKTMVGKGF